MEPKKHIHAAETSAHLRHTVAGAGAVIAAAAIILLPLWAPTSEEVMAGEQASLGSLFEAASFVTGHGDESRARQAERLAREHGTWLRDAHGWVNAPSEDQPLPPQF